MSEDEEILDGSERRLSEFNASIGEPLLRRSAKWMPIDQSKLPVPALLEAIWARPGHAVAPNGHTCPFVTLEEWEAIIAWVRETTGTAK